MCLFVDRVWVSDLSATAFNEPKRRTFYLLLKNDENILHSKAEYAFQTLKDRVSQEIFTIYIDEGHIKNAFPFQIMLSLTLVLFPCKPMTKPTHISALVKCIFFLD